MLLTFVVVSICPVTKWPPKRPFASIALSKFIFLPFINVLTAVVFWVWPLKSKLKFFPENSFSVRHEPSTAMLSPTIKLSKSDEIYSTLAEYEFTTPIFSIIHVNISAILLNIYFNFAVKR